MQSLFKAGITFASGSKAAAATFKSAWATASTCFRFASAMLQATVAPRPVVHLAAAPVGALIRTLVIAVVISPQGPARFLAPLEPDSLLGHTSHSSDVRRAALAVAQEILSGLPIPSLQSGALLIPAFERVPASNDPFQTVDRVVAVPIFSRMVPPFSAAHDGWLQWVSLAAASSLVYMMVAHAVNRVRTYRATIPRSTLDALVAASSRLRSGALELRRLSPPARPVKRAREESASASIRHSSTPPAPERRFAEALAQSLAVDELLKIGLPFTGNNVDLDHAARCDPCRVEFSANPPGHDG